MGDLGDKTRHSTRWNYGKGAVKQQARKCRMEFGLYTHTCRSVTEILKISGLRVGELGEKIPPNFFHFMFFFMVPALRP
jgi:hypothetical protein